MANTYTQLYYHVVFSTKSRQPLIEPKLRAELHPYLGGIVRDQRGSSLAVGGMTDHVHMLMRLPTDVPLAQMLRLIKSNSSKWINESGKCSSPFAWQAGYSAFTVSASLVEKVEAYIRNQESHHRRITFEEELIGLLKRHRIEFDAKYVWD